MERTNNKRYNRNLRNHSTFRGYRHQAHPERESQYEMVEELIPQETNAERKHQHWYQSWDRMEARDFRRERRAEFTGRPNLGSGEQHQHRRKYTNPDQLVAEPRHHRRRFENPKERRFEHLHPCRRFANPDRMHEEIHHLSEKMVHPEPFLAPKDLMHEKWMLEKRIFKLKKRLYKINHQLFA